MGLQGGLIFWGVATHLNLKVKFLTHLRPIKGYLVFTYFINNQSIGVPWDAIDDLFWNFEYLTSGYFERLLTADRSKKIQTAITHRL